MKCFIVLSTLLVAATALPADFSSLAQNESSRFDTFGLAGFGHRTVGGIHGAVWTVWDPWALRDALNSAARRIVYIRGRIDLTQLYTSSPGVSLQVGPYKSILAGDRSAEIYGGGLKLFNQQHVIIADIKFNNAISYAPGERPNGNGGIINQQPGAWSAVDAIDIERSEHVWVNHCEFSDDPWNAAATPDHMRRHDGLIDIKAGASWISISNNIFRNHNLVTLVGHSDGNAAQDIGRLKVSFYLNWYQGVVQRNPRVRYGEVHVFNNLYTDIRDYGIGAGAGARVYVERNVFVNTRRAWGFPSGTPNPMGNLFNDNNLFVNSGHDANIPNNVGFHPGHHYGYAAMSQNVVEGHVRRWAGVRH